MYRRGLLLPKSLRPRIGQPPSNRFQLPWAEYKLLPSGAADITVQARNLHLTTPHLPLPSQRLQSLSTNTSHPRENLTPYNRSPSLLRGFQGSLVGFSALQDGDEWPRGPELFRGAHHLVGSARPASTHF